MTNTTITARLYEDGAGNLHLLAFEDDTLTYMHTYDAGQSEQAAEDMHKIAGGDNPVRDWDGNELDEAIEWERLGRGRYEDVEDSDISYDDAIEALINSYNNLGDDGYTKSAPDYDLVADVIGEVVDITSDNLGDAGTATIKALCSLYAPDGDATPSTITYEALQSDNGSMIEIVRRGNKVVHAGATDDPAESVKLVLEGDDGRTWDSDSLGLHKAFDCLRDGYDGWWHLAKITVTLDALGQVEHVNIDIRRGDDDTDARRLYDAIFSDQ